MSSDHRFEFTKENIDLYLRELAKEYRRYVGKGIPAELILIGGASILINYGFRDMTTDVDALIQAASGMKEAINRVGDRYDLPNGWLNADFKNTDSYTPKLIQYSAYYRTYSNILTIRTVSAEYLIAMKLKSGRQYKSDLSDVLGILAEHQKRGTPIGLEQIQKAVSDLYGEWDAISKNSQAFIENAMQDGHFTELYSKIAAGEEETKEYLIQFERANPGVVQQSNIDAVIEDLRERHENKDSILAKLRERRDQTDAVHKRGVSSKRNDPET